MGQKEISSNFPPTGKLRRRAIGAVFELVFQTRFEEVHGGLKKFNQLLDDDYGMIVVVPHYSKEDFPSILAVLTHNSLSMRGKQILIPVAQHQLSPVLEKAGAFAQVSFAPVVTPSTKEEEEKLLQQGKKIPWKVRPVGAGHLDYIRRSRKILLSGEIMAIAPQGNRMSNLNLFQGNPIAHLLNASKESPKIGVAIVGTEIPGAKNYERETVGGYNFFRPFKVKVGHTLTREELRERASGNGYSVDKEVVKLMDDLAPFAYKARYQDGTLIFPAK